MQEYRRKNMSRTRPLKEGEFQTKGAPYDPEGAVTQAVKSVKKLFK